MKIRSLKRKSGPETKEDGEMSALTKERWMSKNSEPKDEKQACET